MVVELTLIYKDTKAYWDDKYWEVSKEQLDALLDKSKKMSDDEGSKFNLLVRKAAISKDKEVKKCNSAPGLVSLDIDLWVRALLQPSCRSGRCRMGVVLK